MIFILLHQIFVTLHFTITIYMSSQNYLDSLSPVQRQAASDFQGASLIIAGAGSGKTRTLTYRIANMIDNGVKPFNILSLTFTNKAAREMRERIELVMPAHSLYGIWMGTFHGVFRRILNKEAALLGFPENFSIYETADSKNLIKSIVRELELPEESYKPGDIYSRISFAKNSLVTPAAYAANEIVRAEDDEAKRGQLYRIYERYVQRCKSNGAMDFDDILLYTNVLLRDFPEVAQKYAQMFHYIMVDEYQDTNFAQYLIVKKLAAVHGNICVVGDDSQSIYSFRGAKIENILKFQKDFPTAKVYKLEENYRSTQNIVDAANSLIEHNKMKLEKRLFSNQIKGDKIRVVQSYTDKDEAGRVAEDIFRTIYREQLSPSDFAILYRTNRQSLAFEEQLRHRNIAYRIYGGVSFYQRAEVKDMLSYLRLAVNPKDDEALKRIINTPARGIGATSMQRIEAMALERNIPIWDVLKTMSPAEIGIRGGAVKGIESFMLSFDSLCAQSETMDAYEFATQVASRSGLLAYYRASKAIEDQTRLDNIEELLNSIKSFVMPQAMGEEEQGAEAAQDSSSFTIHQWLGEVALMTDMDKENKDEKPSVTMLTVHSSKGLEFNNIYIVGLEEKLFPSLRAETSDSEVEEERRLCYVALTRARNRATLSYALTRYKWGEVTDCRPSRFIAQIDASYLELPDVDIDSELQKFTKPAFKHNFEENLGGRRVFKKQPDKPLREAPQQAPQGFRQVSSSPTASGKLIESAGDISIGSNVCHERFGNGKVTQIEQTPTDIKLTVEFRTGGSRTLLQKFAKLRLLN